MSPPASLKTLRPQRGFLLVHVQAVSFLCENGPKMGVVLLGLERVHNDQN